MSGRLYLDDIDDVDDEFEDDVAVTKKDKLKPLEEKPVISKKGISRDKDELVKDIVKALKKEGYKQQAMDFKQDVDRLLSDTARDVDVLMIAAKYCSFASNKSRDVNFKKNVYEKSGHDRRLWRTNRVWDGNE